MELPRNFHGTFMEFLCTLSAPFVEMKDPDRSRSPFKKPRFPPVLFPSRLTEAVAKVLADRANRANRRFPQRLHKSSMELPWKFHGTCWNLQLFFMQLLCNLARAPQSRPYLAHPVTVACTVRNVKFTKRLSFWISVTLGLRFPPQPSPLEVLS